MHATDVIYADAVFSIINGQRFHTCGALGLSCGKFGL